MIIRCHICTYWTKEKGCEHYEPYNKETIIRSGIKIGGDSDGLKSGIIHYVETINGKTTHFAICGTKPAGDSKGWHLINKDPNCPNCIKKIKELVL